VRSFDVRHGVRRRSTRRRGANGSSPTGDRTPDDQESTVPDDGADDVDPERAARAIVLRQLTGQPRTRAELARALARRGVADDVVERVLGRFSEVGLIDDAAFARAWVDSRHAGRGLARRALAYELRRRGVEDEDLDAAVGQLSPETELATARALVARRLPATRGVDGRARVRRLVGMLARKGYSPGLALKVVREALADEADEEQRAAVEEFAGAVESMEEPGDG
jgi:regulatory protein